MRRIARGACGQMRSITILGGHGKSGEKEDFESIELRVGEFYAVVGPTGSGKSRLIKDIELLVSGDSVTGRTILLDGETVAPSRRIDLSSSLIAHLNQSMRFVLDMRVREFLDLHAKAVLSAISPEEVIHKANLLTEEPVLMDSLLSDLSGGQSRALMIADIACFSNRSVVLIDEIENAGINKESALALLAGSDKIVFLVTHDPHTALMADKRIVLSGGGIIRVGIKTEGERALFKRLDRQYRKNRDIQKRLRNGEALA